MSVFVCVRLLDLNLGVGNQCDNGLVKGQGHQGEKRNFAFYSWVIQVQVKLSKDYEMHNARGV